MITKMRAWVSVLLLAVPLAGLAACAANQGVTALELRDAAATVESVSATQKAARWGHAELQLQDSHARPASLNECRLVLELQPDAGGAQTCVAKFEGTLDGDGWETKKPDAGELGQVVAVQLTDADRKLVHEWKMGVLALECGAQRQSLVFSASIPGARFARIARAELRLQPYPWSRCK